LVGKGGRTEKRVAGSRRNAVLVRRPDVGVTFRSLSDERRYDWLMAQPETLHVDVYPMISLPGGIRYQADFLVWEDGCGELVAAPHGCCSAGPTAHVEDVKGPPTLDTAFRRIRALFDAAHPLGPLRVVRWHQGTGTWEDL
jgi:hypothetical protein